MSRALSLLEYTFDHFTVLEQLPSNKHGKTMWRCQCNCGTVFIAQGSHLRSGHTQSCGCLQIAIVSTHKLTRQSDGRKTPEYMAWQHMKDRCLNPNNSHYKYYGARGITFCERWQSFEAFYADIGPRPSPDHSIDRIDNDAGYSPDNCKWSTRREQMSNQQRSKK